MSRAPTTLLVLLLAVAPLARAWADEPDAPARPAEPPVYILLDPPADLDTLLRQLKRPDFTLRPGGEPAPAAGAEPTAPTAAVVERVAVRGEADDTLAHLTVELRVNLDGDAARWVPIGLDGLTLARVEESGRELPRRVAAGGAWEIELDGRGRHDLAVALLAPVRLTANGHRVELPIPEAASTRLALRVPAGIEGALIGDREPVATRPADDGQQTWLEASMTPRARLEISWRTARQPGQLGPPLLVASGAIAVDVDPGALRASYAWSVQTQRGTLSTLNLKLDPAEELLSLTLDGRALTPESSRDGDDRVVTIGLPEPLRPEQARRVGLTTRRPLPEGSAPLILRGTEFVGAAAQTGVISIARTGDLWVRGQPGRGVRQIDPKADLPADLRARPGTVLGYQFFEQPFDLSLRIDPSPPWVRVDSRTTVAVDPARARVETWLDYQAAGGRLYEVQVRLPLGLELDAVEPPGVVEASHLRPDSTDDARPGRILSVQLSPRARDDGNFRLRLAGRQPIDPGAGTVAVGLFQPWGASTRGTKVAVISARNVVADPAPDDRSAAAVQPFGPTTAEPAADWPRPADRSATGGIVNPLASALWLRGDGQPSTLPLAVTVFPRTIRTQTVLNANVDRRRLEVRQEIAVQVRHGTLGRLDVAVPPALEGRWEPEGDEIAGREALGRTPEGDRRYRLVLGREVSDAVTLRFRYRLPIEPALSAREPTRVTVPRLRPLEGESGGERLLVAADAAIGLAPADVAGWSPLSDDDLSVGGAAAPLPRMGLLGRPGAEPATFVATALPLAPLPSLVVSRLWLRTTQGPEGDIVVRATLRIDSHRGALEFALPAAAQWIGARVGDDATTAVERLPEAGAYRVRLPAGNATGPVVVRLDYLLSTTVADWGAPRLFGDAAVVQTLWELRLPWNRAVVGVPAGWSDRNEWYWGGYVWKRRPIRSLAALAAWAIGPAAAADESDDAADGSTHTYLFGRTSAPGTLRPTVVPRSLLVGVCSGLVLVLGVPLLIYRPAARPIGLAALAVALAVAAALDPNVALLAVQSSAVGVLLLLLAALTQRLVNRRGPAPLLHEPSGLTVGIAPAPGSSRQIALEVGSEESTVIRPRTGTTIDHVAAPASQAAGDGRGGAG